MSIKDLFGKSIKSYSSASVNVESTEYVSDEIVERQTYIPPIDFSTASNFVKYGSAKLYYEDSIKRIYNNYPYDGSKAEQIRFYQSSSYLDRWMYDVKYPKTTGYIELGQTADYGSITNGYGATSTPEFIRVFGGMHTASSGMESSPLRQTFASSAKYNKTLNRTQNWRLNIPSGSTVEFWLKKDSFNVSNTKREVILDLWNGEDTSSVDYGRLTIEIIPSASVGCFVATLQSGSYGLFQHTISDSDITVSTLTDWHHYAMSFQSVGNSLNLRFYVDGAENLTQNINLGAHINEIGGLINGYIGALQTAPMGTTAATYAGKFSGSLDEFRYWKTRRLSREIGYNWFRQVGGGANTDDATTALGVYYKFNEGIVGSASVDSTILDYSGRIANGHWQGYTDTARFTGSALNDSSYNLTESLDPIVYSNNPLVETLSAEMLLSGSTHDEQSGSSLYQSFPTWLIEEDEATNENLKKTAQIMASYFDTLYAQITAMPNLKDKVYVQSEHKAIPFANRLLENQGFITEEIFVDADIAEMFSNADFNAVKFSENITEIKNLIYTNIYNNLDKIYKSKGTEKSVRNLIRCFGIDDEIVKLNVYTDGGIHYFNDKAKPTSIRKKYINFDSLLSFDSTIYQTSSANNDLTFISGSTSTSNGSNNAFTLEADIVIPFKKQIDEIGWYPTPFTGSSIFGFHEAREINPSDYTWATAVGYDEIANLQIYLVRDQIESRMAKFLIKNQDSTIYLTSSYFPEIYDNNHWNIAIRVKPDSYPYAGNVTNGSPTYTLDVYGVNYNIDVLENQFYLTASLNNTSGSAYLTNPKRVYAGAHLTNFTGSVLKQSDIQVGAVRAWYDYIENSAIQQHNKDVSNFGNSKAFRESNMFIIDNAQIPSQELTIFNWDFDTVTGSDTNGRFLIDDITSGSTNTMYGWIDGIIRREYKGIGASFSTSATAFIENEFLYSQKKELPEISYTNDNVFIKGEREINFIKDDDVSDNFYLLEKSMNQIVSEEMLKLFSSIQEFSNLIGRPVDNYRQDYKRLATIREHFFQRVEQDLDLERFIKYYKWIDGSISKMISQLIPASVNFGEGVTDIVESHILERNKYQRRIGLLDTIESTEGIATGIEELSYSWKYGHAPQENWEAPNKKYVRIEKSTSGIVINALSLASSYLSPDVGSQDYSMHAWFKVDSTFKRQATLFSYDGAYGTSNIAWGIQFQAEPTFSGNTLVYIYGGTGVNDYRTYTFDTSITAEEWFHLAVFYDYSEGVSSDAIKVYFNGELVSLVTGAGANPSNASGWSSPSNISTFDRFAAKSQDSGGGTWSIDAWGISNSTLTLSLARELYNGGKYLNILDYSDVDNVLLYYNLGNHPGDSDADGGIFYPTIGSLNLDVESNTKGVPVISYYPATSPLRGTARITQGNNNCLWRKERHERTGSVDRESIREVLVNQTNASSSTLSTVDKAIYQGSTYIPRRLSRPYKVGIDFSDSIHGGINYSKQKNRDFVKEVTTVHGREGASGAPVNVFGIGIGLTDGIDEKQQCRDVYDPNKKDYYNATTQVGRYSGPSANAPLTEFDDYQYKLKASNYWPFNILSGTLNSGYNARIYSLFRQTAIAVNLHSDTVDITNEIPMQGPFTETHVGGAQNRHVPLNKSSSYVSPGTDGKNPFGGTGSDGPSYDNGLQNQYTRPEAWRLLLGDNPASMTPDGAMGFTGPDYGGPYPDQTRQWAIYYREPKAKRPVNISNIQTTTSSAWIGNYQQGYEFLSSFGNQRTLFRKQASGSSFLPTFLGNAEGAAGVAYLRVYGNPRESGSSVFWMGDADGTEYRFEFTNNHVFDGTGNPINIGVLGMPAAGDWGEINRRMAAAINGARALGTINLIAEISGTSHAFPGVRVRQATVGPQGNVSIPPAGRNAINTSGFLHSDAFTGGQYAQITLNETTNYMTLVGQAPYMSGNVFGAPNNNRQPTTDSVVYTNISDAFQRIYIDFDQFKTDLAYNNSAWSNKTAYIDGALTTNRNNNPPRYRGVSRKMWGKSPQDFLDYDWVPGSINKVVGSWGEGSPVWLATSSFYHMLNSIVECYNSPNMYGGSTITGSVCSTTASLIQGPAFNNDEDWLQPYGGPNGKTAIIEIRELQAPGPFGNTAGYNWQVDPGMNAFETNKNFTSGAFDVYTLVGNKNSIEIPRTDLTSSKNFITTQFSAPGGPEVNSRGYLDVATGQYSVYNSINYRNLLVRGSGSGEYHSASCGFISEGDADVHYATGTLGRNWETIRVQSDIGKLEGQRTLLSRHCGKGGMDSLWGSIGFPDSGSLSPMPATYKQHRNTLVRPRIVGTRLRNAASSSGGTGYTGIENLNLPGYGTGDVSFSFWLKHDVNGGTARYVFQTREGPGGVSNNVIECKFDDTQGPNGSGIYPFKILLEDDGNNQAYINYIYNDFWGKWTFVTITWDRSPTSETGWSAVQSGQKSLKVYFNGVLKTASGNANLGYNSEPPRSFSQIILLDNLVGTTTDSLGGEITDFAIWKTVLSQDMVSQLYAQKGIAPATNFAALLGDYWSLGLETNTRELSYKDQWPSGSTIISDIGANNLTVGNQVHTGIGQTELFIAADKEQYNNMVVTSLLPQSDFQYAWIRDCLSGSIEGLEQIDQRGTNSRAWLRRQKVRGYAPKSGEMKLKGGGSIATVSAITFPTASTLYGE